MAESRLQAVPPFPSIDRVAPERGSIGRFFFRSVHHAPCASTLATRSLNGNGGLLVVYAESDDKCSLILASKCR